MYVRTVPACGVFFVSEVFASEKGYYRWVTDGPCCRRQNKQAAGVQLKGNRNDNLHC